MEHLKLYKFSFLLVMTLMMGCIGDDIIDDEVPAQIRIVTAIDSLKVGDTFQFQAQYLNIVGLPAQIDLSWTSSNNDVLSITQSGLATGLAVGNVTVTCQGVSEKGETIIQSQEVNIGESTSATTRRSGTIKTTSSYLLQGDFELYESNGSIFLEFKDNYKASTSLPGLVVYLTNNPSTNNGAYEIGAVKVFSGAVTYDLGNNVGLNTYEYVLFFCKPFSVKVGDGKIES